MVVNKNVTNLLTGYHKICQAEAALFNTWRTPLLESYARRREAFHQAQARHSRRQAYLKEVVPYGLALAVLVFLAGFAAFWIGDAVRGDLDRVLFPLSLFLMGGGGGLAGLCGVVWLWGAFLSKSQPPLNPLSPALKNKLFKPLLPQWWEKLRAPLPTAVSEHGDRGENAVVHHLHRCLDDSHFILHKLQQQPGDDVDAVVVGPKGIWAFEVKYWSGTITWRNGRWQRAKDYYGAGGVLLQDQKQVHQDPDQQWQRMAEDLVKTLRRHARQLLFATPSLAKIHGGLVFAHSDAVCDIPAGAPFRWCRLADLERWLAAAPNDSSLDEPRLVAALDALLVRHHEVAGGDGRHLLSMDAYAEQLIHRADAELARYVGRTPGMPAGQAGKVA